MGSSSYTGPVLPPQSKLHFLGTRDWGENMKSLKCLMSFPLLFPLHQPRENKKESSTGYGIPRLEPLIPGFEIEKMGREIEETTLMCGGLGGRQI